MATYTVKAPDGKTITLQGPDGASQDEIIAQAQKLYKPGTTPAAATKAPANLSQVYNNAKAAITRKITDPAQREKALQNFYADPRIQKARVQLGLPVVKTREQEIRDIAKTNVENLRTKRKSLGIEINPNEDAMAASASRSLFGLPERASAALRYYGGVGGPAGEDYGQTLDIARAENDYRMSGGNTASNVLGTVVGSVAGGGGAARLVEGGVARLARAGSPIVARAGNVLQNLTTLKKGQKVRNVLKVATAGATGGAAQALGEGGDVQEGATYGAIAPVALGATVKTIGGLLKLTRQATRPFSSSTSKAIREVVSEAPESIAARHAALSEQTGTNVPLVAALKDKDFQAVTTRVLKKSPEATEIAKSHTGKYLRGFMDRMLGHVNAAGRTGDAQITSIGELAQLRKDTADDLMKPISGRQLDITQLPLNDLERDVTKQIGGRIQGLAPRIQQALKDLSPGDLEGMGVDASDIANARKLLTTFGFGKPVTATVQEMDSLRRALDAAGKASMASNPANSLAYRNAAKTVRDFVSGEIPAYGQMVDTYAAQSRMMEGFETAQAGKRIADIEDDTLRNSLRTPEGRIGMKAGELYRLREAASGKPTQAISLARDLASEGRLTRPPSLEPGAAQPGTVTENLGEQASANLVSATQGENQVLGRMLDTDKMNALAKNEEGALSPEELVYGAFLGNALASTKARFLASLLDHLPRGFNKKIANNMTDMLFSQDAAMTEKAMRALQKAGLGEQAISGLMRNAVPESVIAGMMAGGGDMQQSIDAPMGAGDADIPSVESDLAGLLETETPVEDMGEPGEEGESPYSADLQQIYDTEDPALLDLISRVEAQESGGDQSAVSSAGAVGVMQVMPETAPEAAQLAGLPWDENAYRTDATYNRLLGIAYLSEMLRQYDGDVEKALAAYNAGPGRVEEALNSNPENWLALLPEETQNYVQRVA